MNKLVDLDAIVFNKSYDILIFCETWLTAACPDIIICRDNFDIIRSDRVTKKGGGILIYAGKRYPITRIETNCQINICNIICCRWSNLFIIGVYRPPSTNTTDYDKSTEEIVTCINELSMRMQPNDFLLICGDFNYPKLFLPCITAPFINKSINYNARLFLDVIRTLQLKQIVNFPTRKANILDLIFLNTTFTNYSIMNCPNISDSDHCSINVILHIPVLDTNSHNNGKQNTTPNSKLSTWDLSNLNWLAFSNSLLMEIKKAYNFCDGGELTVNDLNRWINQSIENALFLHAKKRTSRADINSVVSSSLINRLNPWINHHCLQAIYYKRKCYKRYTQDNSIVNLIAFKASSKLCKACIKNARIMHEDKIASSLLNRGNGNNNNTFWNYVKSECNRSQHHSTTQQILDANNEEIKQDQIVSELNNYFCSVFHNFGNYTTTSDGIKHCATTTTRSSAILVPAPITCDEIMFSISRIKPRKSAGLDNIPSLVIYYCGDILQEILCKLFNTILSTGILPSAWKTSKIIAIPKKGHAKSVTDFRPISILPATSKIFEKVMLDRLLEHINKQHILCPQQYGFRQGLSTFDNLLLTNNYIQHAIDKGDEVDILYFDLRKAFDSVPHDLLISKLFDMGFNHHYVTIISNYLTNRMQATYWNGCLSNSLPCTSGVPQGSILGPVLFNLYINDLPNNIRCKSVLYADDLKIMTSVNKQDPLPQCTALQYDINSLVHWCSKYKLTFNLDKCKCVTYSTSDNNHVVPRNYHIDLHTIVNTNEQLDLGITFDSRLTFNKHISNVVSKANRMLFIISRAFYFSSYNTKLILYRTFVMPQLEYASCIWNNQSMRHSEMLERIQKRATKYILRGTCWSRLDYKSRLNKCHLLNLHSRRLLLDLCNLYKYLNSRNAIKNIESLGMIKSHAPSRPLDFKETYARSSKLRKEFSKRIVSQWNKLPMNIKLCNKLSLFKSHLCKYLSSN